MRLQSATVMMQPTVEAAQKGTPRSSIAGIARNIGSDGRTNRNVAPTWADMFAVSGLSRHSPIIPKIEIRGSEAEGAEAGISFGHLRSGRDQHA